MKKWEYKTVEFELDTSFWSSSTNFPNQEIEQKLNDLGDEGWELANTVANSEYHGQTSKILLIFKRPKE